MEPERFRETVPGVAGRGDCKRPSLDGRLDSVDESVADGIVRDKKSLNSAIPGADLADTGHAPPRRDEPRK